MDDLIKILKSKTKSFYLAIVAILFVVQANIILKYISVKVDTDYSSIYSFANTIGNAKWIFIILIVVYSAYHTFNLVKNSTAISKNENKINIFNIIAGIIFLLQNSSIMSASNSMTQGESFGELMYGISSSLEELSYLSESEMNLRIFFFIVFFAINLIALIMYGTSFYNRITNRIESSNSEDPKAINEEIKTNSINTENNKSIIAEPAIDTREIVNQITINGKKILIFAGKKLEILKNIKLKKSHKAIIALISILIIIGSGVYIYFNNFKMTNIDTIDQVKITYSGVSGFGTATIDTSGIKKTNDPKINEFLGSLEYSLSKNQDLKEGDKIILEIIPNIQLMEAGKFKILKLSKEVEVKGLDYIPQSIDKISKNDI